MSLTIAKKYLGNTKYVTHINNTYWVYKVVGEVNDWGLKVYAYYSPKLEQYGDKNVIYTVRTEETKPYNASSLP